MSNVPEFPLRVIFDDGEVREIESAEELLTEFDSIESAGPNARVWVRDAYDRTVSLRMRGGEVEVFEVRIEN